MFNSCLFYIILIFHTAPCSAGSYMTASGCQQCGENTYSGPGASSCTSCPDGKLSSAGSTSEDDCEYGKAHESPDDVYV